MRFAEMFSKASRFGSHLRVQRLALICYSVDSADTENIFVVSPLTMVCGKYT
jgi:hypothetical protein